MTVIQKIANQPEFKHGTFPYGDVEEVGDKKSQLGAFCP